MILKCFQFLQALLVNTFKMLANLCKLILPQKRVQKPLNLKKKPQKLLQPPLHNLALVGLTILKKVGNHYFPRIFQDQDAVNVSTQIKKTADSLAADQNMQKLKLNDDFIAQHQTQIAFLEKNAKTAEDQKRLETEK